MIIFHLLTEGRGAAMVENGERISLEAGDIVVFPHDNPHVLSKGSPRRIQDNGKDLHAILSQGPKLARLSGGGEDTRFVCGYMACEPPLGRLVLAGLPPIFKVNTRHDASGRWLEQSIRFSVDQAGAARPGGEAVLASCRKPCSWKPSGAMSRSGLRKGLDGSLAPVTPRWARLLR